jgi:hypothetical protein
MSATWDRVLLGVINQAGAIIKRDNALAPMTVLSLCGLISCLLGAYFLPSAIYPLVYTGIGLVALASIAYFILLFKDPGRLQSEKYQLAQERIRQMVFAKELAKPLLATDLAPPTQNPALLVGDTEKNDEALG